MARTELAPICKRARTDLQSVRKLPSVFNALKTIYPKRQREKCTHECKTKAPQSYNCRMVTSDWKQTVYSVASDQYFIRNQNEPHFLTMTVVDWIDVFTRKEHKLNIVDSLNYCQQQKGLTIYGWCLMSNHLHLLAVAKEGFLLSDILHDMKKFTSKQIVTNIQSESESRRSWMLYRFQYAGKYKTNVKDYKFWQDGNYAKECHTHDFAIQKLNYIHQNPVRAMIVEEPEHYLFSSARDYSGVKGLVDIELL